MDVLQVYKQCDLDKANNHGIIAYDVYIHGGEQISLQGIKKVVGYLGFADESHIDLCDIEEVGGDLWVSTYRSIPESIDLSKVRKVGGSLSLDNTPINSLGLLETVGGDVNLRNTNITDLGKLSYIGGNLRLPKRLKGIINLANTEIKGITKYFNPAKDKLTPDQKGLTPSERPIPVINKKNSSGLIENYVGCLAQANQEQVDFYNYFKRCFENGIIIDVKGALEYPRFLLKDMIKGLSAPTMSLWLNDYDRLIKSFPELDSEAVEHFRIIKQYDVAWKLFKRKRYITASEIGFYEEKMSQKLFNATLLVALPGASELSPWGKQHLEDVKPFIQHVLDSFEMKWGRRFLQVFVDKTLNPQKDYDFYKQFYITEEFFNQVNSWEYGKFYPENYEKELPNIAKQAIIQQCKMLTVEAEDNYRKSIGMPLVGEYWRSETEMYYSIKEAFKEIEVKQHASPKWLGRQHLDVYIPKYKIGVEYQGAQHYHPVDYFGGEEAFTKGQERDAKKKRLCDENGCVLIYVDEGYDLNELIGKIKQIITRLS